MGQGGNDPDASTGLKVSIVLMQGLIGDLQPLLRDVPGPPSFSPMRQFIVQRSQQTADKYGFNMLANAPTSPVLVMNPMAPNFLSFSPSSGRNAPEIRRMGICWNVGSLFSHDPHFDH